MRRFMLALGGVVLGLLLVANVASAHVQFFDINDILAHSIDTVTVRGKVICTAGEIYSARATVSQPNGSFGSGWNRGNCSGEMQDWDVRVRLERGPGFEDGAAEACVNFNTRERGTTHRDSVRRCEVVQLD